MKERDGGSVMSAMIVTRLIINRNGYKWVKFFAYATILLLLCVGTAWDDLYTNSYNTVVVDDVQSQSLSINGHKVQQELRLEGTPQNLLLFCSAPSGSSYQNATVTFSLFLVK